MKSQEGEKVDNVTRGLIALGSFAFLSMLFPLMIGIILKEPKKKYKKSC
ncbi:hypothetical protein [Aliarcobacter cryaerophilus]|nr:hypothetical protein [Aliarcobacter cryaerophilus]MCT7542219.1 hypothetical protein [Aliarcobacter cryaerophilus]